MSLYYTMKIAQLQTATYHHMLLRLRGKDRIAL